ncbi:RNA polymerase sigma factor [Vitreimonas flagellata]|uniref:RNA polymerase sigma factor n=1 Tax=Vitreimonas flagellata TaxID=2560861 RepID=UPI001431390F|nr:sigma-70 family RNA polymerase sigma factor [Vitreimonas flagellata]
MTRGLEHALDEYLVLLAQGGSREAAERLVARWSPKLLAFAGRTLGAVEPARDAVQDTWESALRGLARLDDPARFAPWLYAIAARKCTDALRAKYRDKRIGDAVAERCETIAPATDDARIDLVAALKQLPVEQRVAVSLFFGEDMSVADIAAITGVPAGTVKSRLFAARQTLRKHFGEAK